MTYMEVLSYRNTFYQQYTLYYVLLTQVFICLSMDCVPVRS